MAERVTTSESVLHTPERQQRQPREPEEKGTPLFNAGKLDQIKKSLESVSEQSKEIPNSDELAGFLFYITQASGALETLRLAEVERASKEEES